MSLFHASMHHIDIARLEDVEVDGRAVDVDQTELEPAH